MKLLELFEQSGKTVAVTFGRLNPPTIGHEKLVEAVLKQPADAHFLFVSQTSKPTGKNKTRLANPLPFDVKLGFVQQAFPNISIGDTSVKTVMEMMKYLETQGFQNVIFVCGSDRVSDFTQLLNAQNGIDYNLESIDIRSSGQRDPDGEGVEGISGTKMRQAAIDNDLKTFKLGLASGLQNNAEEVFSAVRQGLEPWINDKVAETDEAIMVNDPEKGPQIRPDGGMGTWDEKSLVSNLSRKFESIQEFLKYGNYENIEYVLYKAGAMESMIKSLAQYSRFKQKQGKRPVARGREIDIGKY